ncbi:MAG: NAD(+)/NADH kinase [Syntrophales bacterium]|jgi:NAD+ kinase|nr:NAD(+)/NADH kinase [Syntrophales bacterium]MDD4338763.1 NAD(+)/NADH kinase [Syntrophales bacterium]HOG07247.1 NAD(+)/NADH kinase [Syntrophales bacterium]HOS76920.1 NAD(+)/NADH kinase [Syntrophales bacterium]HQN26277.1 NAD(+)/NADH kinase [Syntrophales bacterium]
MNIKKIGVIANVEKEKSPEYALILKRWLVERGVAVFFEDALARKSGEERGLDRNKLVHTVDMIVVFGGDGTLLRTARTAREVDIPIVGINMGGFGYLTEINLSEMIGAMEMILRGDCRIERRMMLDASISRERQPVKERTLFNDVVIHRGNFSRMVEMETIVNDCYLTTFKADGLIISTPTGSTAYSLSGGGPIVFPEQALIILNPICPHTLTNRPIILPEDATVEIILWTREEGATVTLDGQVSYTVKNGDTVAIRKSPFVTHLVASPHRDYQAILRTKLGWGTLPAGIEKGRP